MLYLLLSLAVAAPPELRTGDIVFQESRSSQSAALKAATGSRWTHTGLVVVEEDGEVFVLEAIQPVSRTPWDAWVARGVNADVEVRRLAEPLDAAEMGEVVAEAEAMLGRPYDLLFLWDAERIYCSELVWKAYAEGAGVQMGAPRRHGDFALDAPEAKALVKKRFPNGVPEDEPVVAPVDLYLWDGLVAVPLSPP